MESPTTLLNTAIHESEGPERTAKVIKACKMITDILPFDKRNHILLEDSELMKCLMLGLPLNPRAIDLIILSMIHKFQSSHHFLKEMWLGFTFIANMDESEWNASRKFDGTFKNYYSATRKQHSVQSRDIDDSFGSNQGGKVMSYCQEIERNKPTVKLFALKYAEQIIDLLIHSKVRLAVPFKPDIPFLLKTFLIFTNHEKAIIKTCTLLETVRQADPKSTIDHEIEEIIVNKTKRASFLATPAQENAVESGMLKANVGGSTIQKRRLERADSGNSQSFGGTPLIKLGDTDRLQVIEETQAIETSQHLSSNHYGSQDYHEEDSFEIDNIGGKVNEQDIITLDKWLCDWEIDEVPLLTKGEHIQDIIQRRENFEALLSFVIDPRLYAVSEVWRRRHKIAMDEYEGEDFGTRTPSVDSPTHLNQFDRLKENRTFHPYMIRSYKAMQVLCDLRNFKYLMQIQKEGLETFYTNLYVTCIAKEKNLCNFNHLAKLTEFLVRKEFHESTRFLIQFNLPFKFLQNISFQYVQHLFLTLFGCSEHIREQDPGAISKVLEYCKISQFFLDLAKAILTGPENLDPKKYDIEYKPQGVGPLLRATTDGNVFFFSVDERPLSYETEVQEVCFPEETKGFVVDIDYLQPVLKAKKNVDFKKLKSMKTRMISEEDVPKKSIPKVSSKNLIKRYPSLVEKGFYVNAAPLREIKLNSKQRLDFEGESTDRDRTNPSRGMHKRNSKSTSGGFEELKLLSKPGTAIKRPSHRLSLVPEGKTLSEALTPDILKNALLAKTSGTTPTAGIMKKPIGSVPQTPKTPNNEFQAAQFFNKGVGQPVKLTPITPNSVKGGSEKKLLLLSNVELEGERGRNQVIATAPVTVRANSLTKQGSLLVKKPSLADGYSTPSMMDIKAKSTSKLDFRIHSRTYGSQTSLIGDPKGPNQVTVARELRTDTIDKNNLLRLNNLYPLSKKDIVLADLDYEAKKPAFSLNGIKGNEHYSLSGCEMLEEMFRRAFLVPQKKNETERARGEEGEEEEEKRRMKKYQDTKEIGMGEVDHTDFWSTVFSENYQVFELLLKNYLLKIKMNTMGENNSGYVAGRIINLLLEKCAQGHKYMEPHRDEILNICKKHFQYLCKMIIQSHAWGPKEGVNAYLQDYQVKDLLDTGRLLLANTLKFVIQCDQANQYSCIYNINDTCWHTLTLWFFTKRTNNIYQQLFYTLFNIILYSTTEKLIVNLLFKINMVSSMYQAWGEICKNNVVLKDNHIDSMFYFLKKMYNQIDVLAEEVPEYKALREQLYSSASWHDLKSHLLIPRKKKKKTAAAASGRDSDRKMSRMSTRGSVTQVNRNSIIMKSSSVPRQLESINESPIHSQRSSTSTVFHPDGVLEFPKIHQSSLVKFM